VCYREAAASIPKRLEQAFSPALVIAAKLNKRPDQLELPLRPDVWSAELYGAYAGLRPLGKKRHFPPTGGN